MTSGGTQLEWNANALVDLTSISGPRESMETIDLGNHDSADATVAGLRDGGEISFEGNFIKGDSTDFQRGTKGAWIIKCPGYVRSGNGILTSFKRNLDGSVSGTIKVTGKPTLTPA